MPTARNVQVMRAGTGVFYSEYNLEDEETGVYQIWSRPKEIVITLKWESANFPKTPGSHRLPLLVLGDRTTCKIHQNARIFAGQVNLSTQITHPIAE